MLDEAVAVLRGTLLMVNLDLLTGISAGSGEC